MVRRSRGHGEDPRYLALVGAVGSPGWWGRATRKVFVPQGGAVWFVSLPLQAAAVGSLRWPWVAGVGVLVWLVGAVFETVGDAQLAAYQRLPRESRPPVLDTGLWSWSRHPNYFGDAAVWWGIWLVAAVSTGPLVPALVTVPAPLAMTYFLAYATGARPLERTMMQRPGYPEYAAASPCWSPVLQVRGADRFDRLDLSAAGPASRLPRWAPPIRRGHGRRPSRRGSGSV